MSSRKGDEGDSDSTDERLRVASLFEEGVLDVQRCKVMRSCISGSIQVVTPFVCYNAKHSMGRTTCSEHSMSNNNYKKTQSVDNVKLPRSRFCELVLVCMPYSV